MRTGYARFREAIRFTRHGRNTLRQLFVGGVLVAFWWLGLPAAALAGYLVRVVEITSSGRAHLPVFDEWSELVGTGGRVLAVVLAYAVAPVVALLFVAVRSVRVSGGARLPELSVSPLDVGIAVVSVAFLTVVVPAVVATYARERRVAAAFDVERLAPLLTSGRYLVAAGFVGVLWLATTLLLAVVTLLTYGSVVLVAPIAIFYVLVVTGYVVGTAAGEAVGELTPETRGPAEFER